MHPKNLFRVLLALTGSALLLTSSAQAAIYYWDGGTINIGTSGNGVSLGTAGNWDTTLTNWDQGNGLAHLAWNNSNLDTAFFGGTGATVTLTAPITVGGLVFSSNSGYTIAAGAQGLTFGAGTDNVRMINTSGTTSSASITGTVNGGGDLVFTSVAADVSSTLTFGGTSTGGWTGTTTVNAGMRLEMTGNVANQVLLNTSSIALNGGTIAIGNGTTGIDSTRAATDRINNSATITVNGGGTIAYDANNSSANAETVGTLSLASGQFNLTEAYALSSGSSTFTFSSISRTGATNTSSVNLQMKNTGLSTGSFHRVVVGGVSGNTPAGEIVGPWFTTNYSNGGAADYIVYSNGGSGSTYYAIGANIAASAQTGWSTDFTTGTGTLNNTLANANGSAANGRLSASRYINSLRNTTAAGGTIAVNTATDYVTMAGSTFADGDVIVLGSTAGGLTLGVPYYVRDSGGAGAGTFKLTATSGGTAIDITASNTGTLTGGITLGTFNLGTYGILNGSATPLVIGGSGGAVTLPTTTSGNLHVNASAGNIVIDTPINNNGAGVLTLVKDGSNTLTLSSTTSNYSGGTVLNAGTLVIGNVNNIGGAGASLTFGGTATLAPTAALNFSTGTLTIGAGAYGTIANSTAAATTFQTTTGTGTLRYLSGSSANILNLGNAVGFTGNLEFRLNGNAGYGQSGVITFSNLGDGGVLQVGGGQSDATFPGQRAGITFNGGASLTFNQRVIELLPRTASNHTVNTTTLYNNSATANIWTINTNLSNLNIDARSFELAGTNTGNNAFNGIISDGNTGGTINFRKDGSGTWILGGANTYTGTTSVITGILKVGNATALGASTGVVTVSSGAALDLNGTTMTNTNALTLNGTGISSGGALTNSSGTAGTYAGLITLGASGTSIVASNGNIILSNTGTIVGTSTGFGLILGGTATGSSMASVFNGGITGTPGAGTLTKQGTGTWTLTGTNTYGGKTIVQAGTLSFSIGDVSATVDQQLGKNAALDLGVAATSSGKLLYTGGAGTLAKNINALGNGSDTIQNSGSGLLTLSGVITKNGTTLTLNGGTNGINITGGITGASFNSDLIIDSGTTTLSVASTYNGPTFIRSTSGAGTGIFNANVINALPTSINRTAVTMDDSGLGGSQLNLGASQSIASLTGAASSLVNLNANTLTIGTATGSSTFAGVISGTGGSLIKDGASILTLTNTNTYDGTTTVTGGILRVDGSGSISTGAMNVSAGALGGTGGTINGAVTLSGTGGMNLVSGVVGDLTLNSTLNITGSAGANSLSFDLGSAAGGADKIIVSGAPTVTNNGVVVAFNQIGGNAARIDAGTYTIIQGSSAPTLANYTLATTKAFGNTYQLQVTGNNLEVVTTQVTAAGTTAFWSGKVSASWVTSSATAASSNWNTNVAGNIGFGAVAPTYNTDVTFGTTTPAQTNLTTTLDADFDINSLTFTIPAAGGVTIGSGLSGPKMLTLESSGVAITSSNTSGTNTISANVGMAASQSWSVASGGTLLVSGNITDFGAGRTLTKTGAGTLRLSGSNTYSGGTNLSAGILSIGSNNAIPSAGAITIGASTTIQSSDSTARSFTNVVSIGGDFTIGGTGNMTFSNTGNITLGATRTITVTNSGVNTTFAQGFSGSGFGITKAGAGTLTLTGNNTYTGATTVSAGSLVVNGGTISNTSSITLTGGMTINNGATVTTSSIVYNANGSMTVTGGSGVTSTLNLNGGNIGVTASNQNNTQMTIDGAGFVGSAVVTNVGQLNWYHDVSNGTINITNGGQMNVNGAISIGSNYYGGTNANMTIGGGTATSTFTGNNQTFYIGNGERAGTNNNDVIVSDFGVLTNIGAMFVGDMNYNGAGTTATANQLAVSGTGTASVASITVGNARQTVNAANANLVNVTSGGTLTTTSGTNSIGFASVASSTANSNTVTVTGAGSTWNASGQNVIVGNAVATATSNNNVLTVGLGGVVSNVATLTVGSGAGTHTGNQLVVNGTLSATTVSVSASNTLSGSGTINGAVTVNGALNPGNSPGQLTFNSSLTLGAGSTTTFELGGTTLGSQYDNIALGGAATALVYGGNLTVANYLTYDMALSSYVYDLFSLGAVTSTGDFSSVTVNGLSLTSSAGDWTATSGSVSYLFSESTGDLAITVIPEPSVALLGGLSLLGLVLRRRRR